MTYEYENPLDKGYKRFYLTKKQHNKLFPYRKKSWRNKFEYYINGHGIEIRNFSSITAIIFYLLLFPVVILIEGFGNFKEVIRSYRQMLNEKKYGVFSGDYISSKSEVYQKIKNLIGEK